jgi:chromosome segregation ATPase
MNILKSKQQAIEPISDWAPRIAPKRALSEEAARAAQSVVDLETERDRYYADSQAWERRANLAEGERDALTAALEAMTTKMEHYQAAVARAEAQLEIAGKVVLDSLDAIKGRRAFEPTTLAAVEAVLGDGGTA